MRPLSLILASVALAVTMAASGPAAARRHDPEKLPVTRIRDLHYGDVLFYLYQDEDFEAITRLTAYQHWNLIPHHEEEGQLLLGGLYLSLGMHNEAGERFQSLLTKDVPTGVRNRAWFYLAQVWYARGYLDKAEDSLRKIQGKLSPELEAQKDHLFANVLMYEGKFDEAIRLLEAWKGSPTWSAYARFNLGVALVRQKRLADAEPFLTAVGTMYAESNELLALKDRANLALGFAEMQADQPAKAKESLERVRLNGPYSNKALLGTGWADAALGDYKAALNPWLELRGRNLLDAAVQESLLAVPYAFSKLSANSQSAEYYESAVESYDAETVRLDDAIARVNSGSLLEDVIKSERDSRYGWFWQLKAVPNAPESRYLYAVLAGHDFQEGLKNYRDLIYMSHTLDRWGDSMEAFGDMIDTRERAYAQRLPRVDALLSSGAVDKLAQHKTDLDNRLNDIDGAADVAALGSNEERDQWARLQRLEAALAAAPDNQDKAELKDRLRLVKGVLFFRLNDSFKARMWQQRRTMKDLDLSLKEAQNRWIRVQRARQSVPTNNGEFAARVAALKARIDALQVRMAAVEQKQAGYLAQVAVAELEQQKNRLATYQVQARFALATMYDRAANPEPEKKPQDVAPTQKGAEEPQGGQSPLQQPSPEPQAAAPSQQPQRDSAAPAPSQQLQPDSAAPAPSEPKP
ncbi:MAG: tetratricopeptide repeat protein [Proteobacteria bacterium]|nr:tetratricopeptide repeat protein [Pseudomonadota bacterium]